MARSVLHARSDAPAGPPTIRPLDPLVVNQIAAGEVVERPASVVKELVENALDAGARRIAVELVAGGIDLVRVADDGCGMDPQQLPLAVAAHATSKITSPGDLDAVATMGFRGEALASIASVSRLRIRSRPHHRDEAAELRLDGGVAPGGGPPRPLPAAGAPGTVVEVRTLFFNTPARRKFLRTAQTEKQRCLEVLRGLALARPDVGFSVTCDGTQAMDLPEGHTAPQRVRAVLGQSMCEVMLEVDGQPAEAHGVGLWGMVGRPHAARAGTKWQWVVLNGRVVRDATIAHALREAYRGLIEPGRHPPAVLLMAVDPAKVDVNVHPAKTEVRFRDASAVHAAVLSSVRQALADADLTASLVEVRPGPARPWRPFVPVEAPMFPPRGPDDGQGRPDPLAMVLSEAQERAVLDAPPAAADAPGVSGVSQGRPGEPDEASDATGPAQAQGAAAPTRATGAPGVADPHEHGSHAGDGGQGGQGVGIDRPPDGPWMQRARLMQAMQVRDSYLVAQDEQGVVIIDQHALHERVMFEALRSRIARHGALESQRLLAPAMVDVPEAGERLEALEPIFSTIGIEATPAGPGRLAIHAFPSLLFSRGVDPARFVEELFEADRLPADQEDALREVLDMMACKAAVKAGDPLSEQEVATLLELRDRVERSASCPHGRPTSVRLTLEDLEKMFGRR